MPLLAHVFCALIGVIANLYLGKLNFLSIAKAVKSNSTALIPMLSTAIVTFLPTVLYFAFLGDMGIPFTTMTLISLGLLVCLNIGMFVFLHSAAVQKRWDTIGQ